MTGQPPGPPPPDRARRLLLLAVCGLGVSAIMTQLVLMRELLSALAGNEMVLGIILGNWFLLTALGAMLGRSAGRLKRPVRLLLAAQVLVGVLPPACVFAIRALRNVVFIRGAEISVTAGVLSCFVLLLPYCLIAGYLLTLSCELLARGRTPGSIAQVYFLDVLGDIAGGLLFSFVLVYLVGLLGHFGILYVPMAVNLALALAVAGTLEGRRWFAAVAAVTAGCAAVVATVDLDALSTRLEYAPQHVVYRGSSPYGQLAVTESAGQYNFFENGVPLFNTHDEERVEETVHYAMAQRPDAERVLLVAGGVSGTAREVLKYPVRAVDTVELDPLVLEVGRRFLPHSLDDPRIGVHATDGRLFVRRTPHRYDVVIADVPDPANSQINRFYTAEFFRQVHAILRPGGVMSISLGGYENTLDERLARLIGVLHRTLGTAFAHVMLLPAGRVVFLASDGPLTDDIAGRIERAGVPTRWVRRDLLRGTLTPDRIAEVNRAVSPDGPVNRDFSPVLYYYHLLYWISRFKVHFGLLEGALLAGLAVYLLRIRPVGLAIFTTGFAASALEVVLLVGFQVLHGYVYHKVGLIVTTFMMGLAAGAFVANRRMERWGRRDLVKIELAVAAFAAALPAALMGLQHLSGPVGEAFSAAAAFPLLAFLLAGLVGLEFPLASKADFQSVTATASRLYTADYVGACVGALLVSTLLIPLVGVWAVCMIVAGLNVASGLLVGLTGRPA